MRKYSVLLVAGLTCARSISAQINYVKTWSATAPEPNPNTLISRPLSDVKQVTQYYDGLGRPVQTVARQGSLESSSGNNYDLVAMTGYDAMGRQNMSYLPYVASASDGSYKTDALTAQPAYYGGSTSPVSGQGETGANAHTQINFELSPLNRPVLSMAPGNSWTGSSRGVQSGYYTNLATDDVRMWTVTNAALGSWGSYTMAGAYAAGTLYKNISTDENGHQVVEFKDIEGKVVLKKVGLSATDGGTGSGYTGWLSTYYIYDIMNNLRCVVQPAGVQTLTTNGWSMTATATLLTDQCFRYEYDQRNRMVMKQVPGALPVYMVYDNIDRLIMTQDANMRASSKWLVSVYDNLNRPVKTGLLNDGNGLATEITNAYNSVSYPGTASGFEMLTQIHYDDYTSLPTNSPSGLTSTFQATWNANFASTNLSAVPYPVMPAKNSTYTTVGLATWTQAEVVGTNGATYLTSVNIYDDKGRLIQVQSQNYSGGIDATSTQYNWSGQPLTTVRSQQKAGTNAQTTVTVNRTYYDNLNRPVKTTKQIQNTLINSNALSAENNISVMQYDNLGELKTKNLGNTKSGTTYTANPLETLGYEYNIRGWLLGVNRAYVRDLSTANSASGSGETFTTPPSYSAGNYFGFELGYDKSPTVGSSSWTGAIQYNGNITGMIWKSVHDGQIRKYDFSYDNVNRLTASNFTQYTGSSFNQTAGINYTANNLSYDANGNIMSMNQYGLATLTATASVAVDQLTYAYITGTNKLQSVSDAANGNTPAPGVAGYLGDYHYASGAGSGAVYTYDNNGNLTSDNNKKISSISYNYLNLPQTITVTSKGTITYTYDAMGNKLQKQTIEGGTTTTTLYGAGTVYINNALQFVLHEEGRIRINSTNNGYIFDYFLKDHLGNTRMTITDDNTAAKPVIDATSYYPFGLTMAGISSQAAGGLENKIKFQKQEFQHKEFSDGSGLEMYEFKYRMEDPQIGRFWSVDPLADKYVYNSTYAFSEDKVINGIELEGLEWLPINKDGTAVKPEDKENINGYKWAGYDVDSKTGEKTAKAGTVATAYTFGIKGRTILGVDKDDNPTEKWESYSSISIGDAYTDKKLSTLHSFVQDKMKVFILKADNRFGIKLRATDGFRTIEQQNKLYAQGRTEPGNRVTNARGGYSNHNFGLAIDVVPMVNGQANFESTQYPLIGRIGQSVGLEWGGSWKTIVDQPHFQDLHGLSLEELRALPKDDNGLPILPQQ
jgi:RHS repeat-associated protein